ncbi:hypothetical protein UT300007_27080 [Clostridium sp. CTA-7]
MLASELNKLLNTNYKVLEEADTIEIFHISYGNIEQEMYIKCKKSSLGWTIYKNVKGNNYEIGTFVEEEYAICMLYVVCIKSFEGAKEDINLKRSLRACNGENAIVQAVEIIKGECELEYFSLDISKKNTICMENVNGLYNIFYLCEDDSRINIVSDATFNRALVVVYSYSILLKEFNKIYTKLSIYYPICQNYYKELLRCYFNK